MSDEQIQVLEALYTAAHGRYGLLVDLSSVKVVVTTSILEELRLLGVIGLVGRGLFTVTRRGGEQVTENRNSEDYPCLIHLEIAIMGGVSIKSV